jgi:GAF domain-containing protein
MNPGNDVTDRNDRGMGNKAALHGVLSLADRSGLCAISSVNTVLAARSAGSSSCFPFVSVPMQAMCVPGRTWRARSMGSEARANGYDNIGLGTKTVLAEVSEGHRVVFLVETTGANGLTEGRVDPRQSTLSHAILSGVVAEAVGDVDANPRAKEVPLCREFRIRAFVGVPVRLASGETFGVLCCFDPEPRPDLGQART